MLAFQCSRGHPRSRSLGGGRWPLPSGASLGPQARCFSFVEHVIGDMRSRLERIQLTSCSRELACHERGRDAAESNGRHGQTRTADLLRVKQAL
jgi:hypothetical protein